MASSYSNSSAVGGIQEEITWFHAWLALDRLITAVRQEVKSSQVYESNKNYNSKNGRITVKIKDYQEISGFTPGVLNRLFGQRNKMTEWKDRVLSTGRITFEKNSYEANYIEPPLHVKMGLTKKKRTSAFKNVPDSAISKQLLRRLLKLL